MTLNAAIARGHNTSLAEIEASLAVKTPQVAWASPGAEAANKITTRLQVNGAKGNAIAAQFYLRLTCDAGTISNGAEGTVISGDDTNDAIVQTNASGQFDCEIYSLTVGSVFVTMGPSQANKITDFSSTLELTFT